jgi:ABC transporter substrate binding protein
LSVRPLTTRCRRPWSAYGLQEFGWILGRNLRIDYRWTVVDDDRIQRHATELLAFAPDVVLAFGSTAAKAIHREAPTLPIVFVYASDPIGAGLIMNPAEPGSNTTGFLSIGTGMTTKWLELLKQIAPRVTRAAVIRDPTSVAGAGQFGAIEGAAPSFGIEVSPIDARDARAVERGVLRFARGSNGGLIVTTNRLARYNRDFTFAHGARFINHILFSETPIAWDFARWRGVLESYRINGRPVFELARDADRAALERLMSLETNLAPSAGRSNQGPIEQCSDILSRTAGRMPVTDDNMGTEWLHFLGLD